MFKTTCDALTTPPDCGSADGAGPCSLRWSATRWKRSLVLAAPLALLPQLETQALTFYFDFDRSVPEGLYFAAQDAADSWSPLLQDDVTVNLRVEYADLSAAGSVLGGVKPGKVKIKYEDYVDALFQDALSSNDFLGIDSLQLSAKGREELQEYRAGDRTFNQVKLESKEFAFLMDGQFANNGRGSWRNRTPQPDFIDNNGNNNNQHLQLTRAQAKALGLRDSQTRQLDAIITINSSVDWDFNSRDGIERDRYDATTVMRHEIGHALGAVSGTDTLDFLAFTGEFSEESDIEKNKFSYLTPMDFYRYSRESAQQGVMDLTLGGSDKYFSLDGGETAVTDDSGRAAYFSTGSLSQQGDGYQGSHWRAESNPLGVMNPVLERGQSVNISQLDVTLLDTIGWDLEDPYVEQAAAVGIDWEAFNADLTRDRQAVIYSLIQEWGSDIPALEAAIGEASSTADLKFQEKLQEKFEQLVEHFEKEDDLEKRDEKLTKFYEDIQKEAEKRNEALRELPEDIYRTDAEVREWLTLPVDKLSKEVQEADGATINRLSNVLKAMPEAERSLLEPKLEAAFALFADKPIKLVEELLDTTGPANPIGWSYFRWYWWWQSGSSEADYDSDGNDDRDDYDKEDEEEEDDDEREDLTADFYYLQLADSTAANTATLPESSPSFDENAINFAAVTASTFSTSASSSSRTAKDIPEPSSVLALFGIAVLGARLRTGSSKTVDRTD